MVSLKKYDLSGKEVGSVDIDDSLLEVLISPQAVKDYIKVIRHNKRQWSASTKGRAEVKNSNQKPHAQKGTGKARQGSIASPQYRGGGIVFGPKPKFDQHINMNRKERRAAIKLLLAEKIKEGKLSLLQMEAMDAPKTKTVAAFMKAGDFSGKRTLFLGSNGQGHFSKSVNNIPKSSFKQMLGVNGYDLALSAEIVVMESALDDLKKALGDKS